MISRIRYWSAFTFFRWQFLLLLIGGYAVFQYLKSSFKDAGVAEWPRVEVWMKILFWSATYLGILSIVTLLISYIFFRVRESQGRIKIVLNMPEGKTPEAGKVKIEIVAANVLRPLLGFIEVRLLFPEWNLSENILLSENRNGFFRPIKTIAGSGKIDLHHRGRHQAEEVQILFTDMLRLITLPVTLHSANKLLTLPRELKKEEFNIFPSATEEEDVRIPIPKRIQGELLNYKDFESGDDIRRIVWKIYARSGELVVRVAETRDPYASHVYIAAGFFNSLIDEFDLEAGRELLNFYKDYLRQVYSAVSANNPKVKFIYDQDFNSDEADGQLSVNMLYIATAQWQEESKPFESLVQPKTAVVCLSSATDASEIVVLLEHLPAHIPVIVFALSTCVEAKALPQIRKIFFKDDSDPLQELKSGWWASPLRRKLKLNEQKIQGLLRSRGNAWLMQMQSNEKQ